MALYPQLAKVLYASYMLASVKHHSCYESLQRIIIVISSAVVVGSVKPSAVAKFRSPPCNTRHQTTGHSYTWRAAV